jgi:hypothetical protein
MNKIRLFKSVCAATCVAVTLWLFWPFGTTHLLTQTQRITATEHKLIKTTPKHTAVDEKQIITEIAQISSNDSAQWVATAFAAELNYPPYSQPLKKADFDRLNPNHFNPQSIPVDDSGASISASLTKYRYTYPESIEASINGENISSAVLNLVDIDKGTPLKSVAFEKVDGQWQARISGERNYPPQLQAVAIIEVNNKTVSVALSLKYIDSVATLESFESAISRAADMVVVANLSVREKGMYRLMANLFDDNDQPIAHLVARKKLAKGTKSIELKVHQSVLQGKEPPFYLSTFNIELMSPSPGVAKKFGNSVIKKHVIDDFSISSLENTPYQPTQKELQRLQLLENMADMN